MNFDLLLVQNFDLLLVQNYDLFRSRSRKVLGRLQSYCTYMFSKVPSCAFSGFFTLKLTQHFELIYDIGKSDQNILRNIMKTAQDSYTITIKQIVRFQKRMHLEKIQVIKFKMAAHRPLFTSTGLILRNIAKTAQDSYTITIKQIVRFQERMHLEKFQVDKIQNGRLSAIIHPDRPHIAEYHENRSRWLHHYIL